MALALAASCEDATAPSPFEFDPGIGGSGAGSTGDGGQDDPTDPTLGGPCVTDDQCDDGLDCTGDACDKELLLCRFTPDSGECQNDVYCDGEEICHNKLGCVLGEPVTCSDGNPCSIDTCVESTEACISEPRDVDQDGDPDEHCGGGDCDDNDPAVSSEAPEICGNAVDDDCNDEVDESGCVVPGFDDCLDPLEIDTPGSYALTTIGAALDYAASCALGGAMARDVVAALLLDEGIVDVQLTLRSDVDVALALMGQCGSAGSEIACSTGWDHPDGDRVAKLRARSVGDADDPLALPAYLFSEGGAEATLRYELYPASTKPANETCGSAAVLTEGTPTLASVVDAVVDVASACGTISGDLLYRFDLADVSDVDLYATSIDGDGLPVLSLRTAACALPEDEITCNVADPGHIYRHSLPAGSYYLAVGATAPTEVSVTLELSAATPPPADETCAGAVPLAVAEDLDVSFDSHQDDHFLGCAAGAVDAAYALDLAAASDVLVLGGFSTGDVAAVALAKPACTDVDLLVCSQPEDSPARARKRNVAAGSYRVLAESTYGQPMLLTALTRPAAPAIVVPFADSCSDVLTIPAGGGFFQGNTQNAQAHFNAGCDQGGQPEGGAKDQILRLVLASQKRVVMDMQGSGYMTTLDLRQGATCPGTEVPLGCVNGFEAERSFLDVTLAAGTYWLQIDGFAGAAGAWFLDLYVVDP